MNLAAPPVYGLILAGGTSSRMQRDKAALLYQGQSQLDRAFELAGRHVSKVFVSVREGQTNEPTRAQRPLIVDSVPDAGRGQPAHGPSGDGLSGRSPTEQGLQGQTLPARDLPARDLPRPALQGPIAGIRSALAAYPDVAWLVIACDLPFLSDAALQQLLAERDPTRLATAFRSAHDGLPEPLCTIWEPAVAAALSAYHSGGRHCPRKFLINHPVKLLHPRDLRALDNINTPEEYAAAQKSLSAPHIPRVAPKPRIDPVQSVNPMQRVNPIQSVDLMQLNIQYFALLREQAGRSAETIETRAATPADLYAELRARYEFTLAREQLKVAVNNDFTDWSRPLHSGDAVVFIPPVAGG